MSFPELGTEVDSRISRSTLAVQLEDAIRLDIISGALQPGLRLRSSDLTQRYGVSATPLREALQRLAAQNLVELGPRLGATVAPISAPELADVYWLRELLEGVALERSIERADDAWIERVTAAYRALEEGGPRRDEAVAAVDTQWSSIHRAFHRTLLEACDSPWLLRFMAILSDHSERYRVTLSAESGIRRPSAEHRAMFEAVVARDAPAAVDALQQHLSGTFVILGNALPAGRRNTSRPVDHAGVQFGR